MGPQKKKTKKPKNDSPKYFNARKSQTLSLKRKKMITEIRESWLQDNVEDRKNSLTALKSPEFQRALWLSLKKRDELICHHDVDRWIRCHPWILEPTGWPTGLRRMGPSPPPVVMASYFKGQDSPPHLEDERERGIKMGVWPKAPQVPAQVPAPIINPGSVTVTGTSSSQAKQTADQDENIADLGTPSQVISLRPVEIQQKYLRQQFSTPVTSKPSKQVPSTPAPKAPIPSTPGPLKTAAQRKDHSTPAPSTPLPKPKGPQTPAAWTPVPATPVSSTPASSVSVIWTPIPSTPQVSVSMSVPPTPTPPAAANSSVNISTSSSSSSSSSSQQSVLTVVPVLTPNPSPNQTPPQLNSTSGVSQVAPTPYHKMPITPKKRILFRDAEYLAGRSPTTPTSTSPAATPPPPPPQPSPNPPPPPTPLIHRPPLSELPVPDTQTPAPDDIAAIYAGVQQLCSVIQRQVEERHNEVQDSLNALNQSIACINPAKHNYTSAYPEDAIQDPNVWQQRLNQREADRLNYGTGNDSYQPTYYKQTTPPPPPPPHSEDYQGSQLSWSPPISQETSHYIGKLTELIDNLTSEAFLSSNPWEYGGSDPRSVQPAKVEYKVKLILNGMDKIITEYGSGLMDQDQLIKLIEKFRKVFTRIIQKIMFPVDHRLAMRKIKMETQEMEEREEETQGGAGGGCGGGGGGGGRVEEQGTMTEDDLMNGFSEVNGEPLMQSPPPPPPPRSNANVANVLPVQQPGSRPCFPIFQGATRPRQFPIPVMSDRTVRALLELGGGDEENEERPPIIPINWSEYLRS